MLAIDTNLMIRYLTGDHPAQARRAKDIIDGEQVFVSTTVLLETEWVLRSVYNYTAVMVAEAVSRFAGLASVVLEDPALTAKALSWVKHGMDFADALHLGKAEGCAAFASFDRQLVKAAQKLSSVEVRLA